MTKPVRWSKDAWNDGSAFGEKTAAYIPLAMRIADAPKSYETEDAKKALRVLRAAKMFGTAEKLAEAIATRTEQ